MAITEGKEGEMEEIFEAIMTDNFPQIHVRHQTTESGNSVNTKQDNENKRKKKKNPLRHSIGEGNGTPLQHSCLGNSMDGGAW